MGNNIGLTIVLDNDDCSVVSTGQRLTGKVLVSVRSSPVIDEGLTIELAVEEYTHRYIQDSKKRGRDVRSSRTLHYETRTLRERLSVSSRALLLPGEYSFPFEFFMHEKLPATAEYQSDNEDFRIQCMLIAKGGSPGAAIRQQRKLTLLAQPKFATSKRVLHCRQQATRTAGPTLLPVQAFACNLTNPLGAITAKCKLNKPQTKGSVALALRTNTRVIGKGEPLECAVSCRRYCLPRSIQDDGKVAVSIVRKTAFCGVEQETVVTRQLVACPGNAASSSSLNSDHSSSGSSLDSSEAQAMLQEDLQSASNGARLVVPTDALDSYSGKLIQISHALRLEYLAAGGTSSADGDMRLPRIMMGKNNNNPLTSFIPETLPQLQNPHVELPLIVQESMESLSFKVASYYTYRQQSASPPPQCQMGGPSRPLQRQHGGRFVLETQRAPAA